MSQPIKTESTITNKDIDDYKNQVEGNKISRIWNEILKTLPDNLKEETKRKVLNVDFAFEFDRNKSKGVPLIFRVIHSSKKLKQELSKFRLYWKVNE